MNTDFIIQVIGRSGTKKSLFMHLVKERLSDHFNIKIGNCGDLMLVAYAENKIVPYPFPVEEPSE